MLQYVNTKSRTGREDCALHNALHKEIHMKPLKILPRRHICSVRGCHSRATFLLTRSDDHTRPVWICEKCILDAAEKICAMREEECEGGIADERQEKGQEEMQERLIPETVEPKPAPRRTTRKTAK